MKALCALACLLLVPTLGAESPDAVVRAYFAPEEVQVIFALPTSVHMEKMNVISRLTCAETSLGDLLPEFNAGSREQELIRAEIHKRHRLAQSELATWDRLESDLPKSDLLIRYYIRKVKGAETGYAVVRKDKIVNRFSVEAWSDLLLDDNKKQEPNLK